jgi:poly-gamma-glutamate synthesis protein (capsule biosynthesis protein)
VTSAPTATTAAPTTTTAARGPLVLNGGGDTLLDPAVIPNLTANGYGFAWSGLDGLFQQDDLSVVNLECTPSPLGSPVPKAFNFRCDPAALPEALAGGVDVANLANNHSGDFGPDALLDSITQVQAAGIAPVGVGADADAAGTPAFFDLNGWRVAVLGFGGVVPTPDWVAGPDHPGMRDGDDTASMVAAVRAAAAQSDLVVVAIHWGVELDTTPRAEDVERARAMVAAGADVIFGGHSHRLQPLEMIDGKPVFYSLGNFVWPLNTPASGVTAVGHVEVAADGTITACLLPAHIEPAGHPRLDDPTQTSCPPPA